MDREAAISSISSEMEALIRLHRLGLHESTGYRARKKNMEDIIRENHIDIGKDLDPVTSILYRRYFS